MFSIKSNNIQIIISIFLEDHSYLDQISNLINLNNYFINLSICNLLNNFLEYEFFALKLPLFEKNFFETYLNMISLDNSNNDLNFLILKFIIQYFKNFSKLTLKPQQNDIMLRFQKDLEKLLEYYNLNIDNCNQSFKENIISNLFTISLNLIENEIFVKILMKSNILKKLLIVLENDKNSIVNAKAIIELLTLFASYNTELKKNFLFELKIIDIFYSKYFIYLDNYKIRKAIFYFLMNIDFENKEELHILIKSSFIKEIENTLLDFKKHKKLNLILSAFIIINSLLELKDFQLTNRIYSKELLNAVLSIIDFAENLNCFIIDLILHILENLEYCYYEFKIVEKIKKDNPLFDTLNFAIKDYIKDLCDLEGKERFIKLNFLLEQNNL